MKPNPAVDCNWLKAEKKIDPSFEGSLAQRLGLTKFLCPTCGSHLAENILEDGMLMCLNACHLTPDSKYLFEMFQRASNKSDILRSIAELEEEDKS